MNRRLSLKVMSVLLSCTIATSTMMQIAYASDEELGTPANTPAGIDNGENSQGKNLKIATPTTLTFANYNGEEIDLPTVQYVNNGEVTTQPTEFVVGGIYTDSNANAYQFLGWVDDTYAPFAFGNILESDQTIYANWKVLTAVSSTYYSNYPTVIDPNNDETFVQDTYLDVQTDVLTLGETSFEAPAGYMFDYWMLRDVNGISHGTASYHPDGKGNRPSTYEVASAEGVNTGLYLNAEWEAIDITYNSNYPVVGGQMENADKTDVQTYSEGEDIYSTDEADFVVPTGYEFSHWALTSNDIGTQKYYADDEIEFGNDTQLYAIWTRTAPYDADFYILKFDKEVPTDGGPQASNHYVSIGSGKVSPEALDMTLDLNATRDQEKSYDADGQGTEFDTVTSGVYADGNDYWWIFRNDSIEGSEGSVANGGIESYIQEYPADGVLKEETLKALYPAYELDVSDYLVRFHVAKNEGKAVHVDGHLVVADTGEIFETAITESKVYDGEAWTQEEIETAILNGLSEGYKGYDLVITSIPEDLTSDANATEEAYVVEFTLKDGGNIKHIGTAEFSIAKRVVAVKATNEKVYYDGNQHLLTYTAKEAEYNKKDQLKNDTGLLAGDVLDLEEALKGFEAIDAGTYKNKKLINKDLIEIDNAEGKNITSNYEIKYDGAKLTILPRTVTLTPSYTNETRTYTGQNLAPTYSYVENKAAIEGAGFVTGENFAYGTDGEIVGLNVTEAIDAAKYTFNSSINVNTTNVEYATGVTSGNYNIVVEEATLTIEDPTRPVVTYYSVTVNYVDQSGNAIAEAYVLSDISENSNYDMNSSIIDIAGYTYSSANGDAISGTLSGDVVINLVYAVNLEEEGTDNGNNNGNEGEPEVEGDVILDIEDEQTPLGELPEEVLAPVIEIEEDEVPLGNLPEVEVPVVEIADEEVPLAATPQTSDSNSLMLQLTTALTLLGAATVSLFSKKRKHN